MKVSKISGRNFMMYDHFDVSLPDRGLVLVTGDNGQGKSALAEAVATGVWGKTLRGTSPWREGVDGEVLVHVEDVSTKRLVSPKGRQSMTWVSKGQAVPTNFETTTKAQQALTEKLGLFDVWRRCSVFSSRDASNFTEATGAERWSLFKTLFGFERFDTAADLCRERVRKTDQLRWQADNRVEQTQAVIDAKVLEIARQQALLLKMSRGSSSGSEDPEAEASLVEGDIESLDQEITGLETELREARIAEAAHRSDLSHAQKELVAAKKAICAACGQDLPNAPTPEEIQALEDRCEDLESDIAEAVKLRCDAEEGLPKARASLQQSRSKLRVLQDKVAAQASTAGHRGEVEQMIATLNQEVVDLQAAQEKDRAEVQTLVDELNHLKVVSEVLGSKGVRSLLLTRMLASLSQMANDWLSKICQEPMRIEFTSQVELKNGKVSNDIGLTVDGAGGGLGYRAASGGQRRRIDLAILLALAEVAGGVHGMAQGTLWLDEVFDALDDEGVDAVAGVLLELSEHRPVVVISHSPGFVSRIAPRSELHLRVSNHRVHSLR